MRGPDDQSLKRVNLPQGEATDTAVAAHNKLWLRWVLAHFLLLSAVWALDALVFAGSLNGLGGLFALPAVIIAPFVAQGIAVRRLLQERGELTRWLCALAIGFSLLILFIMRVSSGFLFPVAVAIAGAVLGLAQGIILLRRYPRALWWVSANAVGLAGSFLVALPLFLSVQSFCQDPTSAGSTMSFAGACGFATLLLPVMAAAAVFSVITGATLAWITQRESSTPALLATKYRAVTVGLLSLEAVFFVALSAIPLWTARQNGETDLNDIYMVSPNEGWAVGGNDEWNRAIMLHYTADWRGWSEVSLPDSARVGTLRSVSMTSADEGWAVGDNSTFLHYTNGAWSKVAPPDGTGPMVRITVVDMLSPSDGAARGHDVVVGADILYHYDGQRWQVVSNLSSETLQRMSFSRPNVQGIDFNAVSMVSPAEGWAVGRIDLGSQSSFDGAIVHYKGTGWTREYLPSKESFPDIFSLSMTSAHEGWAVGAAYTILHYERGTWTKYH